MSQLLEIAAYWSFWEKDFPSSIPRIIEYPRILDPKLTLLISGVRRSGKSTLLTQIAQHYGLDKKSCLFINFEDPRLIDEVNFNTLENLIIEFRKQHSGSSKLYFFLDEIQNLENWQKWIHTKLERPENNYFIITGSNADLLSPELGSSLTGRHQSIDLYPFSFEEYQTLTPDSSLLDYIKAGGFPAVLQSEEPKRLLLQYFNDIIERDIISRHNISNPRTLKQIIKMIFEASGSEVSFRKIAGVSGLSPDTVSSYISYGEAAFLLSECPYFSFSEKQRVRRNSKYYPIDSALRRTIATKTGDDLGKDFELLTFYQLRRKYKDVFYWRDKGEVDFVVQTEQGIQPIQVSYKGVRQRHEKSAADFYNRFPNSLEVIYIEPKNFSELQSP